MTAQGNMPEEALNSTSGQIKQPGRQQGITEPKASRQLSQWVIRLNLKPDAKHQVANPAKARTGLQALCKALAKYGSETTYDRNFSATVGFGQRFFDRLTRIVRHQPPGFDSMPGPKTLGVQTLQENADTFPLPQTDMIIVLGASNRSVIREILGDPLPLRNDRPAPKGETLYQLVEEWAEITDVHEGFRRHNERNLLGFYDGVSNLNPSQPEFDEVVWAKSNGRSSNATFLVFQKIVHDQDKWQQLRGRKRKVEEQQPFDWQEEWVGRHRLTGLMLGTYDDAAPRGAIQTPGTLVTSRINRKERDLIERMDDTNDKIRRKAEDEFQELMEAQRDPTRPSTLGCPVWSHAMRANPRQPGGGTTHLIYRRGCLFYDEGAVPQSGVLFLCYQRDIQAGFAHIMQQFTNWPDNTPQAMKDAERHIFKYLGGGYYFVPGLPPGGLAELDQIVFDGQPISA